MEAATARCRWGGVTDVADTMSSPPSTGRPRRRSPPARPRAVERWPLPLPLPEPLRPRRHPHRRGDRRPGAQRRERFLTSRNLLNIVRFASENGIIAIGMTLVILTGGIDLSVGAVLALCAVAAAALMMHDGPATFLRSCWSSGSARSSARQRAGDHAPPDPVVHHDAGDARVARGVASLWSGGTRSRSRSARATGLAPPLFKAMFAGE